MEFVVVVALQMVNVTVMEIVWMNAEYVAVIILLALIVQVSQMVIQNWIIAGPAMMTLQMTAPPIVMVNGVVIQY